MKTQMAIIKESVESLPDHSAVLLENENVRVLDYRSRPGVRTVVQPRCLIYSFTPARIRITIPQGNDLDLKAGEAVCLKEDTRAIENAGTTNTHLLIIELKGTPMAQQLQLNRANDFMQCRHELYR